MAPVLIAAPATLVLNERMIADDLVEPFEIEPFQLRGRLVRLGPTLDSIVKRHDYPPAVGTVLGEAIALAVALSSTLKYDGVFTLQTKGDGPIRLLVADVTTGGAVRGYAQYDPAKLAEVAASGGAASVPRLLGAGYLAFTVDQGEDTERYQGIVALEGATLAECVHHYFRQSEQIAAGIKVAVDRDAQGAWRGGCLLIQKLPDGERSEFLGTREELEDGWRRALILMGSATSQELTDPELAPEDLLFRLFHEDGVRVFRTHAVRAECRCSRERIDRVLRSLPFEERQDLGEADGSMTVTCQFCNASYRFERADVAAIATG
ncbi:MAG TPA: Hsp33 family molecular chaperone [Stellaceae bacterium]|nr:Hsp33 family molecular chaperone [Stellaceae bacterium]